MSSVNPSGRPAPAPGPHDLYLDWLRGMAALSVFATHVRGGFFVKWSDLNPSSHTAINYLLFLLTRLGRESVIVFFVLSGYLVGGHAWLALRQGRYSLSEYLVSRISRLWVVVVPALLLTSLLDLLSGTWDGAHNGWRPFLVNLLFLQNILGSTYGSNAPFWSLSYEWWFYILFGVALVLAARDSARTRVVLATSVLAASGTLLALKCPTILLMMPLWLAGVVVRSLPIPGGPRPFAVALSFAGLSTALIVSSTRWDWQGDYVVAIAVAAFVYFLRTLNQPRSAGSSLGQHLAAFSFSLYALHYPLNNFVLTIVPRERLTHAGIQQWLLWTGVVLFEASVCWLFYWWFERRTPAVRKALLRLVVARTFSPWERTLKSRRA